MNPTFLTAAWYHADNSAKFLIYVTYIVPNFSESLLGDLSSRQLASLLLKLFPQSSHVAVGIASPR